MLPEAKRRGAPAYSAIGVSDIRVSTARHCISFGWGPWVTPRGEGMMEVAWAVVLGAGCVVCLRWCMGG